MKLTAADVVAVLTGACIGAAMVLVCAEMWLRRTR